MSSHFDEIVAAYSGDDQELRLMIEQRAALAELQASPAWEAYRNVVYSRIAGIHSRMHHGKYADLADYRQDVGLARGLEEAVDKTILRMEAAIAARLNVEQQFDPDQYELPDPYAVFSPAEGDMTDG